MESQINSFHETVQVVGQRWTPKKELPDTKLGLSRQRGMYFSRVLINAQLFSY